VTLTLWGSSVLIKSVKLFVNLIIQASLSGPPSESLYFRYMTLVAKTHLKYSNLLEADRELKDLYFRYLKQQGMMDFIDDIISPEDREEGVRVDTVLSYPKTIIVKKITCENVVVILGQIRLLAELKD
jgi:hypothetical protein